MTKLALSCCAAALSIFAVSCASKPEMPADQATKVRQHRVAPSEDRQETEQAREGSPLPPTREGSWKF